MKWIKWMGTGWELGNVDEIVIVMMRVIFFFQLIFNLNQKQFSKLKSRNGDIHKMVMRVWNECISFL
jgi:hypothetical protein